VRRLKVPTLSQWGCPHRWKTTHSLPQEDALHRVRYHKCRRCGLRVKTEERLAVPWDEGNLIAQVKALLPEGQAVALRDKGIAELPLARLNARLALQGYVIHASKGRDRTRLVACVETDGSVTPYGVFELRSRSPKAAGHTNGTRSQRHAAQPYERKG
jgi:hypothetical protein